MSFTYDGGGSSVGGGGGVGGGGSEAVAVEAKAGVAGGGEHNASLSEGEDSGEKSLVEEGRDWFIINLIKKVIKELFRVARRFH